MSQRRALARQEGMSKSTPPRLDLASHAGAPYAAMIRLEARIELDSDLRELIKVRASQINGCAFCIDMHWTTARAGGESEQRLAQLSAWRESPYYDERERAALALTEAVTHVSETQVPDDVWAEAEAHFTPDELAHLLFAIGAINLWNRVLVSTRAVPASYAQAHNKEAA
jgi:AhpD family alkylhydroperoxidase